MLKKSLLVLIAASLISIAAPFAAAQSPNTQQPSAQGNAGWHHGPPIPPSAPRN